MLDGSTRVKRLHAKRENLIKLTETFEALSSVAEMREDLSVLVESCDYAAALDVVDAEESAEAAKADEDEIEDVDAEFERLGGTVENDAEDD